MEYVKGECEEKLKAQRRTMRALRKEIEELESWKSLAESFKKRWEEAEMRLAIKEDRYRAAVAACDPALCQQCMRNALESFESHGNTISFASNSSKRAVPTAADARSRTRA